MEVISNTEFGGERPLFESHNLSHPCRGVGHQGMQQHRSH